MKYLIAYAICLVIFVIVDAIWLGLVARGLYTERMGALLAEQPRWGVAAAFYALYVAGLVYFAVSTGLSTGSWMTAAMNGGLFGFFAYLTYNATNLAVIRGFDPVLAVIDTCWGAFLGALSAGGAVAVMNWFGRTG